MNAEGIQSTLTYLDGHEEDFGDQDHHREVVLGCLQLSALQYLFNHWEEDFDQLVEWTAVFVDLKFEGL